MFSISPAAETVTLTRTVCCEGYLQFGKRCALCPNRDRIEHQADIQPTPPALCLRRIALPDSSR